ncbi:hypothetical protein ACB098_02G143100 [Castanea mollissima]|uniref:Hydroxyproline-rich glycoprotein family protein n=1 Tax=Castanea mollissima TaxID=60419 RepID=A0A8J4W402_9ROSI|nr:hypothetical protein CMV_001998 [Castanea mollissima]
MESQDLSPPQVDASRPSLGFPLGTALLLIIIFSLSGIFSCCYHWDKFKALRDSFSQDQPNDSESDIESSPSKPKPTTTGLKQNQSQSLPVLMPGDRIPKFIAMPCPCNPPHPEKVEVKVQKPPKPLPRLPVPLY